MTTPTPTVIEEARKMAADHLGLEPGEPFYERVMDGTGNQRLAAAFIAAIELGERRAEAAVVVKLREYEAVHREHSETGKRYRAEAKHHAEACQNIARGIARGDHRSKPA